MIKIIYIGKLYYIGYELLVKNIRFGWEEVF